MRLGGILLLGGLLATTACTTTSSTTRPPRAQSAPEPPGRTIVVQRGDTLTRIAGKTGVAVDEIVEVNGLPSADAIEVGQELFVPAGVAPPPPERVEVDTPPEPPSTTTDAGPTTTTPDAGPAAPLRWPVEGVVLRDFAVAQPATAKRPARDGYEGLLIAAPPGTPVRVAAAGVVAFAGAQGTSNGNFVVVDHGEGLVTVYAHLKAIVVAVGQTLAPGDVVGEIGSTGLTGASTRVQLQVRRDQTPVDPLTLLPP
jgi:murein DD-endopeptidase MepM/ murein hydrolase activator NlpD